MATPWRDGEQGGEVAHGVRGRAETDVPFGGGVAGPLGDGARVPAVGGGPGGGDDAPVPGAVERPGVGGELLVHGGPVLRGQARGFLHQEGGAPFVELPGLQRGQGAGHFGDQGLRQAQEPAALGGGFAPGQGDLRADPGPELGRGHPGVGLFAALEQIEGDGQPGLTGSQGRLSVFQGPDFSNQLRTVQLSHVAAQRQAGRRSRTPPPAHLRRFAELRSLRHCAGWMNCLQPAEMRLTPACLP